MLKTTRQAPGKSSLFPFDHYSRSDEELTVMRTTYPPKSKPKVVPWNGETAVVKMVLNTPWVTETALHPFCDVVLQKNKIVFKGRKEIISSKHWLEPTTQRLEEGSSNLFARSGLWLSMSLPGFHLESLTSIVALFAFFALVIAIAGTRLTRLGDSLADATGLGEALIGAILLGGTTSLAGIMASVTAAYEGQAELAASNAIGGIAAQTAFLAIADLFYRSANLEHAAASLQNVLMATVLVGLLAMVMAAVHFPVVTFLEVHPVSLLLLAGYALSLRFVNIARQSPMWRPRNTRDTVQDQPKSNPPGKRKLMRIWASFLLLAAVVGFTGYGVAQTGIALSQRTGFSATFVGALFTSVATSLPELVVAVSAVRMGALTLSVSNIIGGNAFDVLFMAFADVAYREGSLYHDMGQRPLIIIDLSIFMTVLVLLGLLFRERQGPGGIGWESLLLISVFILVYVVLGFL